MALINPDQRGSVEQLWLQFFSDPLQWWDNRLGKRNPQHPDFKHKCNKQVLWVHSWSTPLWVRAKLATVTTSVVTKSGQETATEQLWHQFFSDPSQWWDHRFEKINARYPDFKHKKTQEALWIDGISTPKWVYPDLGALTPGRVQESLFSWNVRIAKSVKDERYKTSLDYFRHMQREGVLPDSFSFIWAIKACTGLRCLQEGRLIHANVIESGSEGDSFVGSSLIDMYVKCESIDDAWEVFNRLPTHHVVSWNAMILGFVKSRNCKNALELFHKMGCEKVELDGVTFVGVLNACAGMLALEEGRCIHAQISEKGWESDIFVGNALIDMYSKCGSIEEAWRAFSIMPTHDLVSWNTMIMAFTNGEQWEKALELLQQMKREQVVPDKLTFILILKACSVLMVLKEARRVHAQVSQCHCESDVFIGSCLVGMYAKCGSIEDAYRIFNDMTTLDVVSWNTMIMGYVKLGQGEKALVLFDQMQRESTLPDTTTFLGILNACSSILAVEEGRHIHAQMIRSGFKYDVCVGNCLVNMYAKCGSIEDACRVFNDMPTHNTVSWNCMIHGYEKFGQSEEALLAFRLMQREQMVPDPITFVGVLSACASTASFEEGRSIHGQIVQSGLQSDIVLGNCLINMYAKCGSVEYARRAFNSMQTRNLISWTTMLGGYALHGLGKEALRLFEQMHQELCWMDATTYICLLSACSHSGLVDEGSYYIESVNGVYGITASTEFYSCVVDLFGRAGLLDEAEHMIRKMSCEPTFSVWMALLGACRIHNNVEMGERVARQVINCYPENASGYVSISNIYAAAGMWDCSPKLQQMRMERHLH
ncbi:hypothetical protein O6H91_03G011500 [Diphasiastrum complanatum]|nr:hypothetical protein O6H91_03G011500 [Diphasiastrum complanatum]